MTRTSRSLASYTDVHRTLEAAVRAGGLRLTFPDKAKATTFCSRANAYRVLLRSHNAANGRAEESPFDHLQFVRPRREGDNLVDIVLRGYEFTATDSAGNVVEIEDKSINRTVADLSGEDSAFLASFLQNEKHLDGK